MPARLRQVMVSRGRASGIAPAQRLPLVLVAVAPPRDLEGPEPTEVVGAFAEPTAVLAAVNRLLQPPGHPPVPHRRPRHASGGGWVAGAIAGSTPPSCQRRCDWNRRAFSAWRRPSAAHWQLGGSPHHGAPSPVAKL